VSACSSLGPAGSGKSTLLRALSGVWPFGSGRVEVPRSSRAVHSPSGRTSPSDRCATPCAIRSSASESRARRGPSRRSVQVGPRARSRFPFWTRSRTGRTTLDSANSSESRSRGHSWSDPDCSSSTRRRRLSMKPGEAAMYGLRGPTSCRRLPVLSAGHSVRPQSSLHTRSVSHRHVRPPIERAYLRGKFACLAPDAARLFRMRALDRRADRRDPGRNPLLVGGIAEP
jgi:energy-coupling factor transporter ATP-binding protein EcfA2